MRRGLMVGGAGTIGAALGVGGLSLPAFAEERSGGITKGDVAILRFLAAAEIIETDLWQQYNELGGIQDSEVPGGSGSKPYINALLQLDGDMSQYIHDNDAAVDTRTNGTGLLQSQRREEYTCATAIFSTWEQSHR